MHSAVPHSGASTAPCKTRFIMPYAPGRNGLGTRPGPNVQSPPMSAGRRPDGLGGPTRGSTMSSRGSVRADPHVNERVDVVDPRVDNVDPLVFGGSKFTTNWHGRPTLPVPAARRWRPGGGGTSTVSTPRVDNVDPLVLGGSKLATRGSMLSTLCLGGLVLSPRGYGPHRGRHLPKHMRRHSRRCRHRCLHQHRRRRRHRHRHRL